MGREVAQRLQLFPEDGVLRGWRDGEGFLDAEQDLDHAQRVDVEVLEARLGPQLVERQAEVLREQRLQALEGREDDRIVHAADSSCRRSECDLPLQRAPHVSKAGAPSRTATLSPAVAGRVVRRAKSAAARTRAAK